MLPRRHRVSKREFKALVATNTSKKGEFVAFRYVASPDNLRRYAVVVPKKIYKTSVSRHVVKRRIVALLREVFKETPPVMGALFVIKSIEGIPREVLFTDLKRVLGISQ